MKRLFLALALLCAGFITPAFADVCRPAGSCAIYGGNDETWQYRLCDRGYACERMQRGYGFGWTAWERMHSNVQPPCRWNDAASTWTCRNRTITCKAGSCT